MRIGLLYVDDFHQPRSQRIGSLGLGYIAAYLQQEIPGCEVALAVTPQELKRFEPDMIGISSYSETLPTALAFAEELKSLNIPLVLGGPHIATNPMDLNPLFDLGVIGEGEDVFLEVARLLDKNAMTPQHYSTIQGLSWHESGQVKNTGRAPDIQNLDKLAHADRQLMFDTMYRNFKGFSPLFHIHTSRGCPFRCTFCSAPLINPKWRFHSPEWVVTELESIARAFPDCDQVTISDDLFTLNKGRVEALVKAIREAGLHKRFFFVCSSRSNTLDKDMCRLMSDMNMLLLCFGMESASDAVIRELKGRGTSQEDYQRVLDLCQQYGLYAHGNFIIGAQNETCSDLKETHDFISKNRHKLASIYVTHMTPFPGTKVWDDALEAKRFEPENLDYRLLNLEYDPEHTVLLSEHYDKRFYTPAHGEFQKLYHDISPRFTEESGLIKQVAYIERFVVPEHLRQWTLQAGIQHLSIIGEQTPHWGMGDWAHCERAFYTPEHPPQDTDAILLYYALERVRSPLPFLQGLPQDIPCVSLNYNMCHVYTLVLLLMGQWDTALYGPRQRDLLQRFSAQTLASLFQQAGFAYNHFVKLDLNIPLSPQLQGLISQLGDLPDASVFAYLSLWNSNK